MKVGAIICARREALLRFDEVYKSVGLDGVVTYKLWRGLGYPEVSVCGAV